MSEVLLSGESKGARDHQNSADQLTLFKPGWADFAPQTTASPKIKKTSTPLKITDDRN